MNRSFTAESWGHILPKKVWYEVVTEANDLIVADDAIRLKTLIEKIREQVQNIE